MREYLYPLLYEPGSNQYGILRLEGSSNAFTHHGYHLLLFSGSYYLDYPAFTALSGGLHYRSVLGFVDHVKEAARTSKTQRSSTGGKAPSGGPPQAGNGDCINGGNDNNGNGENISNGNRGGNGGDGNGSDPSGTPMDIASLCQLARDELELARSHHEFELMAAVRRRDRTDTDAQNRLLTLIDRMLEDAEFDTMFAENEDIRDICHKIHVRRLAGLHAQREVKIRELQRKFNEIRNQDSEEDANEEEEETDETSEILSAMFYQLVETRQEGDPDLESEFRELYDRAVDVLINIHSSNRYRNDARLADMMCNLIKAKERKHWITFTFLLDDFVERGAELAEYCSSQSSAGGPGRASRPVSLPMASIAAATGAASTRGNGAVSVSSSDAIPPTYAAIVLGSKRSACNDGDADKIPSKAAKKG